MSKAKTPDASGIPVHCAHLEIRDLTELVPNPRNPNKHPDTQVAILAKVIRAQGWRSPIVVSRRSGFIVKGHGRYEAAKVLQVEKVPVDVQDYENEASEWADLIADNRIAELAETDDKLLNEILGELKDTLEDFELTGFTDEALDQLLSGAAEDAGTPQEREAATGELLKRVSVAVDEPKTGVEDGDIWKAGIHTVICCSVFTDWNRYMQHLKDGALFLPYAGPLVLITEKAGEQPFVVVQPDAYLCGHMLDKWSEIQGEKPVKAGRLE